MTWAYIYRLKNMKSIDSKFNGLKRILKSFDNLLIAFSGGIDSAFLLNTAHDVLGERVGAVTAGSLLFPEQEFKRAVDVLKRSKINFWLIEHTVMSDQRFVQNPVDRCYICKNELFLKIRRVAGDNHYTAVADGSNFDDSHTYRPGRKALKEQGIRCPLYEAKLTKAEIRELSERAGLSGWDRPSSGCLASRFPYGVKITDADLQKVDQAESCIRDLRDIQVRVRHLGDTARIEVMPADISLFIDRNFREQVLAKFNHIGYRYVTLDLRGYRCGSMDEALDL